MCATPQIPTAPKGQSKILPMGRITTIFAQGGIAPVSELPHVHGFTRRAKRNRKADASIRRQTARPAGLLGSARSKPAVRSEGGSGHVRRECRLDPSTGAPAIPE